MSAPVSKGLDLSRPRGFCPERVVGLDCFVEGCSPCQGVSHIRRGAGLPVFLPRGLVSCRVWQGHGTVVQDLCRRVWVLLLTRTKLRSENRVDLHVSIPERMVSCRLLLVHERKRWAYHRPIRVPWPLHCGMVRIDLGHRIGGCSEGLLLPHALFRY